MSSIKNLPSPDISNKLTPVLYHTDSLGVKPALVMKATGSKVRVVWLLDTGVQTALKPNSEVRFMTPNTQHTTLRAINFYLLHAGKRLGVSKDARRLLKSHKDVILKAKKGADNE